MKARHILLTGGTGVLGRELVPRLLNNDSRDRITLLIRPRGGEPAESRLDEVKKYVLKGHPEAEVDRLEVVTGDVSLPELGLARRVRERLCSTVTHVVHGAATTRLDESILQAQSINVAGTQYTLEFAGKCPGLRLFAHISTAHVCGDREGLVFEKNLRSGQGFLNEYEASKCRAEEIIRGRMNDLPIAVFRPAILVGDTHNGRISSFSSLYSPLYRIAEGAVRRIPCPEDAQLDLVPVDYVAECLVRLMNRPGAVGSTYHLCAGPGRRTPVKLLFEEAIRIAGKYPARRLRFGESDAASAQLEIFFEYPRWDREFCDATTRAHLGRLAPPHPDPAEFLLAIFEFCRSTNWGRRGSRKEKVPCRAELV